MRHGLQIRASRGECFLNTFNVELYDFTGRLCLTQQGIFEKTTLNLKHFKSGIYSLIIKGIQNQIIENKTIIRL
jgi:hypothetical protein